MSKQSYKNNLSYKRLLTEKIQKYYRKQEYFFSYFYLVLKVCFSLLALVSLIKLGYIAKIRITRLEEIQNTFVYENGRFKNLTMRFDELFSLEGEQRFMKDQDQMISRDIIRVIWR